MEPIELFFDLVYVLAITQVTHRLLDHLTLRGALETVVLITALWFGWVNTTWMANYFDVRTRRIRLVLVVVMFASLLMSAFIPRAFEDRGIEYAVGSSRCSCWGRG